MIIAVKILTVKIVRMIVVVTLTKHSLITMKCLNSISIKIETKRTIKRVKSKKTYNKSNNNSNKRSNNSRINK